MFTRSQQNLTQKLENKLLQQKKKKKKTVVPELRDRTVRDSIKESSESDTENHTHPTIKSRHTRTRLKGMSTKNNIGVQTRAMTQWVDNEANPGQLQKAMDQATNPTIELHRTKEDAIKEFI